IIQDPTGAAVSSAKISARSIETGFERTTSTDASGLYEVPLLPTGTYELTVTADGFAPYKQSGIAVLLAKASSVDVRLSVATAQPSVEVKADASILTVAGTDISGDINSLAMENLPLTTRNTFNLALFAPGYNGRRDDEFGNPTFAFGGLQRKAFLIDGVDNSQRGGPGRLGIFAPETVQEVKVIANAMD